MARFTARVHSTADISATRAEVWDALTVPETLTELTPLLERIDADGDLWTWNMKSVAGLGISIAPSFTERMTFTEKSHIEYSHEPPPGRHERAGAEGIYQLDDISGGTRLDVSLILTIELPLPRASARAVEKIMKTTMERTGDKFAANLLVLLDAKEF